jgi:hypothetical protein
MTFTRTLTTLLFASALGCAAIPFAGDDIAECPDGSCTVPSSDAGIDSLFNGYDSGLGDGAVAAPRASLCGTQCNPDIATACMSTSDAGPVVDDAAIDSCRMVAAGQATCVAAGTGDDGASCMSGADCAPGFECVGAGVCRHYCCTEDTCAALTASSNSTYFCDVAIEKGGYSQLKVPVCAAAVACDLLSDNSYCPSGTTCTIVETEQNTSLKFIATCDTIGKGVNGDSCETAQCAAGFACIGQIGSRTCQQLCNASNPCGGSATCNITLNMVGICTGS